MTKTTISEKLKLRLERGRTEAISTVKKYAEVAASEGAIGDKSADALADALVTLDMTADDFDQFADAFRRRATLVRGVEQAARLGQEGEIAGKLASELQSQIADLQRQVKDLTSKHLQLVQEPSRAQERLADLSRDFGWLFDPNAGPPPKAVRSGFVSPPVR